MERTAKRMLIGAGVGAGVLTAAELLPALFMHITTDRTESLVMKHTRQRMIKKLCNESVYQDVLHAEARLEALPTERVTVTAVDGTTLVGHWYPCEQPKRIVIAMHGWRSTWARDFGAAVDFWRENGCSILFAEQRGQGSSGGSYLSFGMLERYDCLSWANYVFRKYSSELPIYLSGLSMGATSVLLAAELPLPESVRGIVADCGFISPDEIWHYVTREKLHLPYRLIQKRVNRACQDRFGCEPAQISTVQALKHSKIPVLLIHGEEDEFVPPRMSVENQKACAAKCDLLLVPGAQHGESFLKAPKAYKAAVQQFWSEND